MKVAQKARSKKQIERDGCQMALIYELEADTFREIVKDYPKYSNNLLIRGELRTAYFKYLTNLKQSEFAYKMKIIEIEKHIIAGIKGRYVEEDEIIQIRRWKGDYALPKDIEIDEEETFEEARTAAKARHCRLLCDLETKVSRLYGRIFASECIDCVMDRIIFVHEGLEKRELDPMSYHD